MNVSSLAHKLFGQLDLANLNSEKSVVIRSLYAHTKLAIILFTRELSKWLCGSGTLMMFVTYKTCNIEKCVFVYVNAYFCTVICPQCFHTVGLASEGASGPQKNLVIRCWHRYLF